MNLSFIKNINKYILDTIFPIYCLSCGQEGEWVCPDCINKISIEDNPSCPRCHKVSTCSSYCQECKITSKMNGIIVASSYENKLLQKIIRNFKYKYIKDLMYPLGNILCQRLEVWNKENFDNYLMIPIPLHKKKQKIRGFNQAELLARAINIKLGIQIEENIIKRIKHTPAQAKLSPLKRRKNIKNAFKITSNKTKDYFHNKKLLLVDDVCTTSSTLEECAKETSKLCPKEIWSLVLARGK